MVEELRGVGEIVMRDDEEFSRIPEPMNGFGEGRRSILVESAEGFVQQINLRLLGPRTGKEGALLLSAGERLDLPVREGIQFRHLEGLVDYRFVTSSRTVSTFRARSSVPFRQVRAR